MIEDTPLNNAVVKAWLVAAVRRARKPGCKFDTMLILESDEGFNKSTALNTLAGDEYFNDPSGLPSMASKQVIEETCGFWIIEHPDLAGMKKADVEHMKANLSRRTDRARGAYDRLLSEVPRAFVEAGTTNLVRDEYMQSQTGNRRLWPMVVETPIDIARLSEVRSQILGEAARLESEGFSITLDESFWSAAGDQQEERRSKHPWESVLSSMPSSLEIGNEWEGKTAVKIIHDVDIGDGQTELRVSSRDIFKYVLKIPIERQNAQQAMLVASMMKRLGWQKPRGDNKISIDGEQVRGFFKITTL
jgi:predicted P-loop ATPase